MAAPADHRPNAPERLIAGTIGATYLLWLVGALYMAGPLLGWTLAAMAARAYFLAPGLPADQRPGRLPLILWCWIAGMAAMLVILIIGHVEWQLGFAQTMKSATGWAKGWALLAIFLVAGYALPIRLSVLSRAVCGLGMQTLILLPVFLAAPYIGVPAGQLWVSPLAIVGGGDDDFFAVIAYTIEPGVGTPRWQFFAPWSPAAGVVALIHFMLAREEAHAGWRWTGIVAAILMALLSTSRMAVIGLVVLVPIVRLIGAIRKPSTGYAAAPLVLLSGWFAPQLAMLDDWAVDSFNGARAASSRVRAKLGHIAVQRWEDEAFWFGHGKVERGPHPVEFMPIGSHHSWYGLLFVKGITGLVALAVPMVLLLCVCLGAATRSRAGQLALGMVLIYWFYTFGENIEVLTYIAWPALMAIGIVLRMRENGEDLPAPVGVIAGWMRREVAASRARVAGAGAGAVC